MNPDLTWLSSFPRIAVILDALRAIKNWRAALLVALTLGCAGLEFTLFSIIGIKTSSLGISMLGAILALLIGAYGLSAAGFILMQEIAGKPALSMAEALILSLMYTHRWLAIFLLASSGFFAFAFILILVLFLCKIPVLGPMLYALVLPVAALLTGLFMAAMGLIVVPLTFSAVWQGSTVTQVLSALWIIVRQRLFQVLGLMILLVLLYGFVMTVTMGIVFFGLFLIAGFSALVLPVGRMGLHFPMGMENLSHVENSYLTAGALGSSLLLILAMTPPLLVLVRGYCLIYLQMSAGLNFSAAEKQLQESMVTLQHKAQEKLHPSPPSSWHCSQCKASIAADEIFCSRCGHKLP